MAADKSLMNAVDDFMNDVDGAYGEAVHKAAFDIYGMASVRTWTHFLMSNARCIYCGEQDPSTPECKAIRVWRDECFAQERRAEMRYKAKGTPRKGKGKR